MHSRSSGVKPCSRVTKYPLLRMFRWVSVAPFGKPVVPDVYWMLIGSSGDNDDVRAATSPSLAPPVPATISSQSSSQKNTARSSDATFPSIWSTISM